MFFLRSTTPFRMHYILRVESIKVSIVGSIDILKLKFSNFKSLAFIRNGADVESGRVLCCFHTFI